MAFKVAASMGFKKAMESAQAGLLEPVMAVEVTVPDDLVGTVIGDLNSRRGRIQGMDVKGHNEILKAHVALDIQDSASRHSSRPRSFNYRPSPSSYGACSRNERSIC